MIKKTGEEKDLEYFEKMKVSILNDLKRGRHISAILGSINRGGEWWKNKLENYKNELFLNK